LALQVAASFHDPHDLVLHPAAGFPDTHERSLRTAGRFHDPHDCLAHRAGKDTGKQAKSSN